MSKPDHDSRFEWSGRIRPIAICVFRRPDGALLLAPGYDSVKQERFYRPLGGEIEFGELAKDAARREIREELGCEIIEPRLVGVFENIFTYLGAPGHELVFVFAASLADASLQKRDSIMAREGNSNFEVHWVQPHELKRSGIPVYPVGLLEAIEAESARG